MYPASKTAAALHNTYGRCGTHYFEHEWKLALKQNYASYQSFYNPILLDCEVFEKFMMYLTYHNTAYVNIERNRQMR